MADKTIGQLTPASQVTPTDLFVLEQSGTAKKLTGQILENWLVSFADGHGGIQSIEKTGTSGLTDTYTITLSDTTTMTFTVTNGKGIQSIATYWAVSSSGTTVPTNWSLTRQSMTSTNRYLWSHQTITYNDGSIVNTTSSVVGVYGDKGDTGNTGVGISTLAQTARTPGVSTTYTFTMTDGSTKSFISYDGVGIANIAYTSSSGLVDTYTVTMTNGDTDTFTVTNAKSITSVAMVSGTHAPGTTDTYRITFNDGDTTDFTVYNGTNGTGSVSAVDGIQAVSQNVPLLLTGNGAPTASTVGQLNQRYFDLTSHILYICTAIDSSGSVTTYSWAGTGVPVDSALSTMSSNPVQNSVITNRFATLETSVNGKLNLAGGTMNGNIVMANKKITNLGTPTANGDAVNKSYVDSNYRTATAQDAIDSTQDAAIGIVVTGKRPSIAVTAGQYVIVRNSTISGISDGLYTANSALSPSTNVTAANLSAVLSGGLNMVAPISLGGTGANAENQARKNLETAFARRFVIGASQTITLSCSGIQAFLMVAAGTAATRHGLYIVGKVTSDESSPIITPIYNASGIVLTAGNASITVQNSAGSSLTLICITTAYNNLPTEA